MKKENKSTIDGSPSCIQIAPETKPKDIDKFLNELNQSIEELNLEKFCELQMKYPFVSEVGEDPFFEEIAENIKINLKEGKKCLEKTDGFCHSCLMNEPVKIFGTGSAKIGIYYHFDSKSPIELHACSFCFKNKLENENETEVEYYTRMLPNEERDSRKVELVIEFGRLMEKYNLKEAKEMLRDDIELDDVSIQAFHEGKKKVYAALLEEESVYREHNISLKAQVVFYGNNEQKHNDINKYHGLPCLLVEVENTYILWLIYSTDKYIYHIKNYMLKEEDINKLTDITLTGYYV